MTEVKLTDTRKEIFKSAYSFLSWKITGQIPETLLASLRVCTLYFLKVTMLYFKNFSADAKLVKKHKP